MTTILPNEPYDVESDLPVHVIRYNENGEPDDFKDEVFQSAFPDQKIILKDLLGSNASSTRDAEGLLPEHAYTDIFDTKKFDLKKLRVSGTNPGSRSSTTDQGSATPNLLSKKTAGDGIRYFHFPANNMDIR